MGRAAMPFQDTLSGRVKRQDKHLVVYIPERNENPGHFFMDAKHTFSVLSDEEESRRQVEGKMESERVMKW